MKRSIVIRPVSVADAEGLHRSCWTSWPVEVIEEAIARVENIAQQRRGMGVVAFRGQDVLGYGQLTLWPRAAEISDLIVQPSQRSKGIGTSIIGYLVDTARQWQVKRVEIGAAESNPRALALYKRLGFVPQRSIVIDQNGSSETITYLVMKLNDDPDQESSSESEEPPRTLAAD